MYSPISQNERHVNILKELLLKEKIIKYLPVKSAVIIANPKTILNKRFCPKAISNNIVKYDQISNLLKKDLADTKNDMNLLEKSQYKIAEFLVENNKPITFNYEGKYSLTSSDYETKESVKETSIEAQKPKSTYKPYTKDTSYTKAKTEKPTYTSYNKEASKPVETPKPAPSIDLYDSLKKYRLDTSRKEGIKPYFVFNNKQLDELVEVKPKTTNELLGISGFGEKTVEKYGQDIIGIIVGK
jgi:superfamily II DNA helicase RecQ